MYRGEGSGRRRRERRERRSGDETPVVNRSARVMMRVSTVREKEKTGGRVNDDHASEKSDR